MTGVSAALLLFGSDSGQKKGRFPVIFQRVNRSDAERVFTIQQNVSAAAMAANTVVVWDTSSSADGVRVTTPLASTLSCIVGITNAAIADSAYGLIQTYGFRSSALCVNHTSIAIVAGDSLIPVASVAYLNKSATGTGLSGFVISAYAVATTSAAAVTTSAVPVFIRCL
jgi:hypothetical protein